MASPRSRQAARLRARRRRAQQRARFFVVLGALAVVALVTLVLTAFDPGGGPATVAAVTTTTAASLNGRPAHEPIATIGNLQIELPVAQASVTAIGFHGSPDGALELQPVGRQANGGILARLWRRIAGVPKDGPTWFQLEGEPGTEIVDVGAPRGSDVYSPAEGSVVGITDIVVAGRSVGSRVDIRPTRAPSVVVSVSNVLVDPAISVGSQVIPASSRLGTVADIAAVERQSLSDHTMDDGNNVALAVYPSAGSLQ